MITSEKIERKNNTIEYYNKNALSFADNTKEANMEDALRRFLAYIPDGGKILDFGCGCGRDTKYFITHGYQTDALDGSEALCRIASAFTGIPVKHMLFQELSALESYDGIWACASILHLPDEQISGVMNKMQTALVDNGIMYLSFKYGIFEGVRNERYFTDMDEAHLTALINKIPELKVKELWISRDVRPGRGEEKWLNVIVKKDVRKRVIRNR